MSQVSPDRLAEVFVEVADTLVDEFDVIEFLEMVTNHSMALVDGHATGLLLADQDGNLQLMAASSESAEMLELFQIQALEGPCHDCYREGGPVVNADLREAAERWPRFAPHAVRAGYRSVHAFPLRLRKQVIGALNLFGVEVGDMSTEDARLVQAVADVATIGLLQERAIRRGEVLAEQLQGALDSRIVLEQAKGALAQIHQMTPDTAFALLRGYCRRNHLRLSEVAAIVIETPDRVPELTRPASSPPV
jgi:GAF domain-containing protein